MTHDRRTGRRLGHVRAAFTIVELLIVVTIVIVLLSILIVALSAATRTSQKSKTQYLMNSIKVALVRFKGDIGYYPPVLGPGSGLFNPSDLSLQRKLWNPPAPTGHPGNWYSTTSIPEYLLGYGHHYEDGYGEVPDEDDLHDWSCIPNSGWPAPCESPALGIRHPGADGVWGATANGTKSGSLTDRMRHGTARGSETAPFAFDQGKVFGPYLELQDDRLLGCITHLYATGSGTLEPSIAFPGDPDYDPANPHVIVDYWGHALRYYRKSYPTGALAQSHRAGIDRDGDGNPYNDPVPTLSDFYFLRPYALKPGGGVTARLADGNGDRTTTSELEAAEFAIFSSGPDTRVTNDVRVDENPSGQSYSDRYNKDNLVEVGP